MGSLSVIVLALVPVAFVILLGVVAGRLGVISPDRSRVLAALALDFCLPALLFAATAVMTLAELENWHFFLGIAIGLLGIYVVSLALSLAAFRKPMNASSLQALQLVPEHGVHGRARAHGGDRHVRGALGRDRQPGVEFRAASLDLDAA